MINGIQRHLLINILGFFCLFSLLKSKPQFKLVTFDENKNTESYNIGCRNPKILIFSLCLKWGGVNEYLLTLYNKLVKQNVEITWAVYEKSLFHQELSKLKIDHYVFQNTKEQKKDAYLSTVLLEISKHLKPDIIHINDKKELKTAQLVTKKLNIGLVAQFHEAIADRALWYHDCDAFIGVSSHIVEYLQQENQTKNRNISFFEWIPPLFNEEKYLTFTTTRTKDAFFKEFFNVELKPIPLICVIANLYTCKNHELVIHAMHKLICEENTPVQAVFAGHDATGTRVKTLSSLAKQLEVVDYVHFLGFTKEVPEILYHSDIKILPSKIEAFPLVIMEAALMKKPIILSQAAHSANIVIEHNKTGLLCDPNNSDDLAEKIKYLVNNPSTAKQFGENAYSYVTQNIISSVLIAKIIDVYKKVYEKRRRSK